MLRLTQEKRLDAERQAEVGGEPEVAKVGRMQPAGDTLTNGLSGANGGEQKYATLLIEYDSSK